MLAVEFVLPSKRVTLVYFAFVLQFITVPWHLWYIRAATYLLPSVAMDPLSMYLGACNGMSTFKGRGVEFAMGAPAAKGDKRH